jgi:hypothetical protein
LSINGTSGGLTKSTMVTLKVSNNGK